MKGVTPVIATVLLLLMAVAAVGAAWVWYQQMQSSSMAGGTGQVDSLKKSAVSVSPSDLKCTSIGNYNITMSLVGTENVRLTELTITNSTGDIVGIESSSANLLLGANTLTTFTIANTSVNGGCDFSTSYKISARIGAQFVQKDFPVISKEN